MPSQSSPTASATPLESFKRPERCPADDAVIADPPPPYYSTTGSDSDTPRSQARPPKDAFNSENTDKDSKNEDFARREEEARAPLQKYDDLRMQEYALCDAGDKKPERTESALVAPSRPDGLTNGSISKFILFRTHGQGESSKEPARDNLLRWNATRFESRCLPQCEESECEKIKEGVGCVVDSDCLNELNSAQVSQAASQPVPLDDDNPVDT